MNLSRTISRVDTLIFQNYRIVHGIRIALAFVITLAFTNYLQLPESTWILITLVVVMAPISYLGNVLPRAWHRTMGTLIGALSGIAAIFIGQYSQVAMYLWCSLIMFLSAYFALGKRPYVGLLIGITLSVTIGGGKHDVFIALWRGLDVTVGCILAVLFCLIYPQRAFIHWRMTVGNTLNQMAKMYRISCSPNLVEQPDISKQQRRVIGELARMDKLSAPSIKESKLSSALIASVVAELRNTLYSIELLHRSYWSDRSTHLNMLYSDTLADCQQSIEQELESLANLITKGAEHELPPTDNISEMLAQLTDHLPNIPGEQMSVYSYIWLNCKLMEDLINLRRLLIYSLNLSQSQSIK
ncbi:FUSC family protein [Vibrio sp. NH-UV-68]|uniref:FUSC family protein n=1 Tax=unclassified Vibrio TaxID=2614977 RepID=UPI0036F44AE6